MFLDISPGQVAWKGRWSWRHLPRAAAEDSEAAPRST